MIYRLGSGPMVHAPGIISWAISGYWNEPDRQPLEKIVSETWSLPSPIARGILSKEIPYSIDRDVVVVEVPV